MGGRLAGELWFCKFCGGNREVSNGFRGFGHGPGAGEMPGGGAAPRLRQDEGEWRVVEDGELACEQPPPSAMVGPHLAEVLPKTSSGKQITDGPNYQNPEVMGHVLGWVFHFSFFRFSFTECVAAYLSLLDLVPQPYFN